MPGIIAITLKRFPHNLVSGNEKKGFSDTLKTMSSQSLLRGYLPLVLVLLISCIAFLLRILPVFFSQGDPLNGIESVDTLYQLRQVELMVENFPSYPFFDPMTFFPYGYLVNWGPVYGYILTVFCILAGAATRVEIVRTAVFVPPLLAILTIPLVYLIGKKIHSTWCGIVSAAILAVIPGSFFYTSYYGVIDHHIAEILFGTAFCLSYMTCLLMMNQKDRRGEAFKQPAFIIISVFSGLLYLLGFLNMPTMIIFALIAAVFTFLQYLMDFRKGIQNVTLLVLNASVFGIAAAGSYLFMQKSGTFLLTVYSLGHPAMYLMVIVGTAFLFLFGLALHGRSFRTYILILSGLIAGCIVIIAFLFPSILGIALNGILEIFGQKELAITIVETEVVGAAGLWELYSFGLVLFFGGIVLLGYRVWKETRPEYLFVAIWTGLILLASYQHLRYNYLLAVPFALMSGYFVMSVIEYGNNEYRAFVAWLCPKKTEQAVSGRPRDTKKKTRMQRKKEPDEWKEIAVGCTILLCAAFILNAVWIDIHQEPVSVPAGWKASMAWIANNTPDPGIEYTKIYAVQDFSYPPQAYGIISWWDYGHLITYHAKRIPNSNPFQAGVRGKNGAAAFFMEQDENAAGEIIRALGTRYIITDVRMATSKFWAIATWHDTTNATSPYIIRMNTPVDPAKNSYQSIQFLTPAYHRTLVTRLHLFDGSEKIPADVTYIEYTPASKEGSFPEIRSIERISWDALQDHIHSQNGKTDPSLRAMVVTRNYKEPASVVPALSHFRLIYESPDDASLPEGYDIGEELKQVKVFEFVKGARIKGSGKIRIDLEANTGRRFTYIQESNEGEFIVPYATDAPNGAVSALGPYEISGENRTIHVSESAIRNGLVVFQCYHIGFGSSPVYKETSCI